MRHAVVVYAPEKSRQDDPERPQGNAKDALAVPAKKDTAGKDEDEGKPRHFVGRFMEDPEREQDGCDDLEV